MFDFVSYPSDSSGGYASFWVRPNIEKKEQNETSNFIILSTFDKGSPVLFANIHLQPYEKWSHIDKIATSSFTKRPTSTRTNAA